MARKPCCGGRKVQATVQPTSEITSYSAPQGTEQLMYIGGNLGTETYQSPSRAVYKVSGKMPYLLVFEQDKEWFLSRKRNGKFLFAPVDTPAEETIADTRIPDFDVSLAEVEAVTTTTPPPTTTTPPPKKRKYTRRKKSADNATSITQAD